jgi:hypothetical protein
LQRPRLIVQLTSPRALLMAGAVLAAGLIGDAGFTPSATAKPAAAVAFCSVYATSKICETGTAPCTTCHTNPPGRNTFGAQVESRLLPGEKRPLSDAAFTAGLPNALKAIEQEDADGDGFPNLAEILGGTLMADATSTPRPLACAADVSAKAAGGRWNVCGYDPVYAFKKVNLDFCGKSATRADIATFSKLKNDPKKWQAALSTRLDECLTSRYWGGKNGVVWNIANAKIRPAHTVKSGENPGPIPLGDYDDDYNLFAWANTGDRDVRELLRAQYYVKRVSDDPVKLEVISEEELAKRNRNTTQNVPHDKRVGMITTRWNAASNTMFTPIPRTTAAQAYRAYLGYDISKMQGLIPVNHSPEDYDNKGVKQAQCAVCHTTLDPLTYPFTRYNGIGAYNYSDNRLNQFVRTEGPTITQAPPSGVLLGKPVKDLLEWGQVAADSDPFAQKVVFDYWKVLVGREPDAQPADQAEYSRLWRALKAKDGYNYRVEKMLHGLILTSAYGRP